MNRPAIAVVMAGSEVVVTHRQLDARSTRLARLLRQHGLSTGDGIAIVLENHPRFFEIAWAAQRSGLYYTPLNTRLKPDEIEQILADSGSRALVTSERMADVAAPAAAAVDRIGLRLIVDGKRPGFTPYEPALAAQPAVALEDEQQGMDLLYSAGSTGRPKGIRFPLPGVPPQTPTPFDRLVAPLYGFDESTVYLSPAPLYHAAPLRFCMAVLRRGGTVIVMQRFDPAKFLATVERFAVTHTQVVPTMMRRLLEHQRDLGEGPDLGSLRCLIHAAAPCPEAVKRAMIEWLGPIVCEYYAGTERNGFVAASSEDWLAHPGTVGRPVIGEIHVVGERGEELPPGIDGTVYFGDTSRFEYLGDSEQTAASRHPSGWTTMGDIGHVDDDGYLFLTDRQADVIISGGVNVYAREVENALLTDERVQDVAVFGVPHPDLGEEVAAVVELADSRGLVAGRCLDQELIAHCRGKIADFKCPKRIVIVSELRREPTGKIRKGTVREHFLAASRAD